MRWDPRIRGQGSRGKTIFELGVEAALGILVARRGGRCAYTGEAGRFGKGRRRGNRICMRGSWGEYSVPNV